MPRRWLLVTQEAWLRQPTTVTKPVATWHTDDLTVATAVGDPAGYVFDAQATEYVIFRGPDNHIHELRWG